MRSFLLFLIVRVGMLLSRLYTWLAIAPPAAPEPVADGPKRLHANLDEGRDAFNALIANWYVNWHNMDNPDIPQPERAALFVAADTMYGLSMRAWVRERGGLIGAVVNAFLERNLIAPQDPRIYEEANEVAAKLVQTSTALGGGRVWEGLVEYEDWKGWSAEVSRVQRLTGVHRGPPKSGRMVADVVDLNDGPTARTLGLV